MGEHAGDVVDIRIFAFTILHHRRLTPAVYTSARDSGVLLTVRYLTPPRERRGTAQVLWERVLDAFQAESDVDLAYPTQRLYLNPLEGKIGARAELPPLSADRPKPWAMGSPRWVHPPLLPRP